MKLSKTTVRILERLQEDANWCQTNAARKFVNDESLPSYFDKDADYYKGLAWGKYSTIQLILSEHNAYNGYKENEVKVKGKIVEGFELQDYYFSAN